MAKKNRKRGNRRENRHERRQEQQTGGGDFGCHLAPSGMETFKPEKGETYNIDIIPYIVGGINKNADEGDEYFELSYPCYNNLGIEEKRYVAIGEMLGARDPIAEHFAALRKKDAEWDDMKAYKPTWRQLMLIFVHEQADKGLQLFEAAYGTLGELLDEEINSQEEDYVDNFDDPEAGATLEVRFKAKNIGTTNPWIIASKINFEERQDGFDANGDEKLADEILEKAASICLDKCLKITDYATLKAALDGRPIGSDDAPETQEEPPAEPKEPKRGRKPKAPKKEEEGPEDDIPDLPKETKATKKPKKQPTAASLGIEKGGDVEHDEHGTCTVLRIAKDGLSVVIMDSNDEVIKGVDPTDLEPIEEEAVDPEPAPKAKAKAKPKKEAPAPEEEEAPEEEPEDEPGDGGSDDWDDDWED